jgi:DNA repair protein RAD57
MTDLLHILPNFPVTGYTHLIPSLEKHLITCTDLLTLDPPEIAKRAQLPVHDVRKLAEEILAQLQGQLGLRSQSGLSSHGQGRQERNDDSEEKIFLGKSGVDLVAQWSVISTLDTQIDAALGGGIPTRYITEITGERYMCLCYSTCP